jgi:hypothetical protein
MKDYFQNKTPIWLVLYPEGNFINKIKKGTFVTPQNEWLIEKSKKFSQENKIQEFEYVLVPRSG